jgi:hypothetical protein
MAEGVVTMLAKSFVCASLLSLALVASACADEMLITGYPSDATPRTDTFASFGYGFYANASGATTINALGYYDADGDGLSVSHTVALVHYTGVQEVIAIATIPAGTEAKLVNGYRWVSIPTLTLTDTAQGADWYSVVATHGTDAWCSVSGTATVEQDANIGGLTLNSASCGDVTGLAVGSTVDIFHWTGPEHYWYIGGNIGTVAIPEPSSMMLLACGLFSLVAYAWRKRK